MSRNQIEAFQMFEHKMSTGKDVTIMTIGGSMAAGVDCNGRWPGIPPFQGNGNQCSYSSRFTRSLTERYYGKPSSDHVTYINRAAGGTTTAAVLPHLPILVGGSTSSANSSPDFLIIDFSVNDAHERQDWAKIKNFVNDQQTDVDAVAIMAATESLVRYLLRVHPQMSLLFVEYYCHFGNNSPSLQAHRKVALAYGIPFVVYTSLLNQENSSTSEDCVVNHPSPLIHEKVREGLDMWWSGVTWRMGCDARVQGNLTSQFSFSHMSPLVSSSPLSPKDVFDKFSVCESPLSIFDASRSAADGVNGFQSPDMNMSEWTLQQEDGRIDRAAWASTTVGSSIKFPLRFGRSPRVAIIFKKSYETFGDAELSFDGISQSFTLRGCCNTDRVTQGHLEVLNVAQEIMQSRIEFGVHGFDIQPFSEHTMSITLQPSKYRKFEVMFVSSCCNFLELNEASPPVA
jgi:hypothetical protein